MPSAYYKPSEKLSKYVYAYFLMENEALPDLGLPLTIYPNGNIFGELLLAKHYLLLQTKGKLLLYQIQG
jgi:hypothetical protein